MKSRAITRSKPESTSVEINDNQLGICGNDVIWFLDNKTFFDSAENFATNKLYIETKLEFCYLN